MNDRSAKLSDRDTARKESVEDAAELIRKWTQRRTPLSTKPTEPYVWYTGDAGSGAGNGAYGGAMSGMYGNAGNAGSYTVPLVMTCSAPPVTSYALSALRTGSQTRPRIARSSGNEGTLVTKERKKG